MFESHPQKMTRGWRLFSWKTFTLILVGFWLLGIATWYVLTPYLSIWSMQRAARNEDAQVFCTYIDFPVFRENLKAELNAKMLFEVNKDENMKSNPFSGLAALTGPAIINNMVDGYVTPAAIERMFEARAQQKSQNPNFATQTFNEDFLSMEKGSINSGYKSYGEFQVSYKPRDGNGFILIFERRGLFSWQLINMKIQ